MLLALINKLILEVKMSVSRRLIGPILKQSKETILPFIRRMRSLPPFLYIEIHS